MYSGKGEAQGGCSPIGGRGNVHPTMYQGVELAHGYLGRYSELSVAIRW